MEGESPLLLTVALLLHLASIVMGYRLNRWLVEYGTHSNNNNDQSWWNLFSTPSDPNISQSSLTKGQVALLHTFSFWLLVVGFICRWRHEILLVILIGVILLQRQYPSGMLPPALVTFGMFALLSWIASLVFTVSLFIWSYDIILDIIGGEGGEVAGPDYYQALWIASLVVTLVSGFIASNIRRRRTSQYADDNVGIGGSASGGSGMMGDNGEDMPGFVVL